MKKPLIHIYFILFCTSGVLAQTINEGILYISENTQFSTVARLDNHNQGILNNDGEAFIYNDFNNDGTLDFYQNTGVTNFFGSENQTISGDQVSYFYNVVFDNSSNPNPFQLSGEINISGTSNFITGIVDNDNFEGQITFNTDASHINTSDLSHVDGLVNKFGDKEFIFPIGDGGYYRFAGISAPENASALFKAKFYYENSAETYSHDSKSEEIQEIDDQEYWTVEKLIDGSEDGLVTLSWSETTTPSSIIEAAQEEALTIVRWDETTNMWIDEGGAVNLDDQTITTAVSNYGVFTLGRVNSDSDASCSLIVYNYVSPNGDGKNDYFIIDQSENGCAKDLHVQVYNRWGVKVYETNDYGQNGNVFNGYSSGRLTVNKSDKLPASTYYYIIKYQYNNEVDNQYQKEAGFLYLSDN